ncbi:MAG TPA: hypothetical protein EYP98_17940 [Planctomycetes bacterium]|nr:hypothetical protein [Planctomycetota bacterium]
MRVVPGSPSPIVTWPWAARPMLLGDNKLWPKIVCNDNRCQSPSSSIWPLTTRVPKNMPTRALLGVETRSVKK